MLLALIRVPGLGVEVNGNTNWLGVGPFVIQPAEIAKLAIVLWAAHVYARKEKRLGSLHEVFMPVVPGIARRDRAGRARPRPRHRAGAVRDPARRCCGWSAHPAGCSRVMLTVVGVVALCLASTSPERLERLTNFADPFKDFHDAGWQPAHGLYALSTGGVFGQGIGASQQKWGDLPEAHTDFIFAVLGEELGLVGTLLVIGLFLTIAYAAIRVATHTADPFVRYMTLRHRRVAARPDDHQRRHGARAAPGHRHPAAAGLVRRLRAGAVPGRARPADRVRAPRARGGPRPRPAQEGPVGRSLRRPASS